MLPEPLHPAVVHLPLALAVIFPALAILTIVAIRMNFLSARSWIALAGLQALLLSFAWAALETGEIEEERVEEVVVERYLDLHEEAAERFVTLCAIGLVLTLSGLIGPVWRWMALAGSVVVLGSALQVGRLGGELVYRHGAAQTYVAAHKAGLAGAAMPQRREQDHEEDDD